MSTTYPLCPYCGREMENMRKIVNRKYAKNKNDNITVCFDGEATYSYACNCEGWNKQDLIEYRIEKLQNEINSEYEKLKNLQKNSLMITMKDKAREKIESGQKEIRDIGKRFCDFNGNSFGVNKINDYLDKIAKETEKKNLDDKINKSLSMKPKGFDFETSIDSILNIWKDKSNNYNFYKYYDSASRLKNAYLTYLSPLCHVDAELDLIKMCYKAAINIKDGFYKECENGKVVIRWQYKNSLDYEIMSWDNIEENSNRIKELLKDEE